MGYLRVTENGAGRVSFSDTDETINGLFIANLYTCTAIIIIGKLGMSVVHDEGFLSVDSIDNEFTLVGKLKQWSIFYNPNSLKGKELDDRQEEMQPLINKYGEKYVAGKHQLFCKTKTGKVLIPRTSPKKANTSPEEVQDITPKNLSLRVAIRHINNLCAFSLRQKNKTHRIVPVDIQFNGSEQTEPPPLLCDYEQADKFISTTFDRWEEKEVWDEYQGYWKTAFPGKQQPSAIASSIYLSKYSEALDRFNKLKKLYEDSGNEKLLPQLVIAVKSIPYSDYESAEEYGCIAEQYLELALKSTDEEVRKEAQSLQEGSEASYDGWTIRK